MRHLNKITFFVCCLLIAVSAVGQKKPGKPVPIIFDSDMGPDYDDVGAITLLHALADSGQANILATMASTNFEGVAAVMNAFNTYFKRSGTPVGVPKGKAVGLRDFQHWTDTIIAKYPHDINSNAEARDAIDVYRQVLANQPDNSVTIVTVGFLTNLANLQNSAPDKWSKLNGKELIKKKVKLLVCMAGIFPKGKEFNVEKDAAASQQVFSTWETPVIFSGFEIGAKIFTGLPLIHNDTIQNSPVKDVFRISIPLDIKDSAGRKSWDETAVLVAIKGYEPYYTLQGGHIEVDATGFNTWSNVDKKQYYLVEKVPAKTVQDIINKLMMHQPRK